MRPSWAILAYKFRCDCPDTLNLWVTNFFAISDHVCYNRKAFRAVWHPPKQDSFNLLPNGICRMNTITKKRSTATNKANACIYCGKLFDQDKTNDHIPPKSLFEKRFRHLLPTVPSCISCNNGASKDDEYFKRIVLSEEVSISPFATEVIESFRRNLEREESKGLREDFKNSLTPITKLDETGNEYETREYEIDLQRIGNVIFRTAKGLLWVETRTRLPDDAGIVMAPFINLKFLDPHILDIFVHILFAEKTSTTNTVVVIPDVFEYWWSQLFPGGVLASAWVMRFYRNAYFICLFDPTRQNLVQQFESAIDSNLMAISD